MPFKKYNTFLMTLFSALTRPGDAQINSFKKKIHMDIQILSINKSK